MKISVRSLCCAIAVVGVVAGPVLSTGCAGTSTRKSTGEVVDDAGITTKVKAKFAADPGVSALRIGVTTFRGVVQLSGFANTRHESLQAEHLAAQVPGVTSVQNDIVLKPQQ